MTRPTVLLAMRPSLVDAILPPELLTRLSATADVDPDIVLTDFEACDPTVLAAADVLLTSWEAPAIDERALERMPRLRAVIHAAGSVKHHVEPAVWEHGITVSSAAEVNALPVAQYTLAAILLGGKRAFSKAAEYAHGGFAADPADLRFGNDDRTVGIIGASRVGRLVLPLLAEHGFRLLVNDPTLDSEQIRALVPGYPVEPASLDDMMTACDVISLHAPELPETWHLIDEEMLSRMRDGALLVNTSRGSLVDTEALIRHCESGRIDAILDVTEPEPLPAGHPLFQLPNVLITPHLAGSLGTELRRFGEFAVRQVERFASGQPLQGEIVSSELSRIA